jgi:NinB protein
MEMNQNFILAHELARKNAQQAILEAPTGYFVSIKPPTRTLMQNNRLWAMLTDVSRQVDWYGRKLTPENWKDVFTAALKKQDVVPAIDGGFVVLGRSTSNMTKQEMIDLQELISAFGAERNIKWSDYEQ